MAADRPVPGPGILDIAPYVGGEVEGRRASSGRSGWPRTRARSARARKAIAAYRALAGEIHRYPDGSAAELREALGRHHGLDPARIVCGSGSDELIGAAAARLCRAGRRGAVQPARLPDVPDRRQVGRRHAGRGAASATSPPMSTRLLARVTERTRIVFIANPNNPTGTYLSRRRGGAAACRAAAARRAGDRRGLCRVRQPQRLRAGRRAGRTAPRTS